MFSDEDTLKNLNAGELYFTLKTFANDDVYLQDVLGDDFFEELVYNLDVYDITTITSDDRIKLTQKGEKLFQNLAFAVELSNF